MKRLFTTIVLAMVLISFSVGGSEAGVKKIRPDQLKPYNTTDDYIQNSYSVSSAVLGSCSFSAAVRLPVGKRITKLKHYHRSSASPAYTDVYLRRVKMGEKDELVAVTASNTNVINTIIAFETETIHLPKIKNGYTYYIQVSSSNYNSHIHGIKIFYQD